jgi:amino acid transporter
MGKIEDLMVYTKLVILVVISFVLINNSQTSIPVLLSEDTNPAVISVLVVASITFVAYEGFELVINAVNEMEKPEVNIPKAIYSAIFLAMLIYIVIALGAILAIPFDDMIHNKEYALASGAEEVLGHWGTDLVIIGALLATCSAISGTVFGASRQMATIAKDGYLPAVLARRKNHIPVYAIITMAVCTFSLIIAGNLQVLLEFGSVTFLLVSLLMAFANFRIRDKTGSSIMITLASLAGLLVGTILILAYEFNNQPRQLLFIVVIYAILTLGSWLHSRARARLANN